MFSTHGAVSSTDKMVFRDRDRTHIFGRCAVVTMSVGQTHLPKSDCTTQSVLGASPLLAAIFRLRYTFVPALTNYPIIWYDSENTIARLFTQLERRLFKHSKHLLMSPCIFAQTLSAVGKNMRQCAFC